MKSINQNHYYNHGIDTKVAFVFSAPGKLELYNNRPVVGETGVILENLLKRIKIDEFNGLNDEIKINRYKFRITNSWPEPLYKKKNNRTEAKVTELREEKNKKRLLKELGDIEKYIFVFGKSFSNISATFGFKTLQTLHCSCEK
ncbi:MAG: uracil-DNA glycosylase family protein [Bacteroidales bacterium]|nr:uracil-DNA glycosylase family protein [Bacteroidales bacterium]